MIAVGLDIGTTTVSAVVVNCDKKKLEKSYTIPNNSFIKTKEEWEKIQDPECIFQIVKKVLENICKEKKIDFIGVTGQMHGIVYVDKNGNHVSPLYTWQDERGNQLLADGYTVVDTIKRKHNVQVFSGYGLVTHYYNMMRGLLPQGAVKICTIMDYIIMRLTGKKEPVVHISNAASMGFFSAGKLCFDWEKIEEAGIDRNILPAVIKEECVLGHWENIPVYAAIGDNQASFCGSIADDSKEVLLNVGTGSQISVCSKHYFESKNIECRPYTCDKYLLVGAALCGGRAYAILMQFFKSYTEALDIYGIDHYAIMEKLAKEGTEDNPLTVDTRFLGTRLNPDISGKIENIREDNFKPGVLIKGVLNGMTEELLEYYKILQSHSKGTKLVIAGNGIRKNKTLQRIVAAKFEMPIQIVANQEEAACGVIQFIYDEIGGNKK